MYFMDTEHAMERFGLQSTEILLALDLVASWQDEKVQEQELWYGWPEDNDIFDKMEAGEPHLRPVRISDCEIFPVERRRGVQYMHREVAFTDGAGQLLLWATAEESGYWWLDSSTVMRSETKTEVGCERSVFRCIRHYTSCVSYSGWLICISYSLI